MLMLIYGNMSHGYIYIGQTYVCFKYGIKSVHKILNFNRSHTRPLIHATFAFKVFNILNNII